MTIEKPIPVVENDTEMCSQNACCCSRKVAFGAMTFGLLGITCGAFFLGKFSGSSAQAARLELPPAVLNATATHSGTDMAIATGQIDDDSEGLYTLDFKTGELTCYLYYPRFQRLGGMYRSNVTDQLPATKNAEYLMVTGTASTPAVGSNNRPSRSLVYVVDTKSGMFAAYGVSTNKTLESSGQQQIGPMVFVFGGEIRPPSAGAPRRTLPQAPATEEEETKAAPEADNNRRRRQ